MARRSSVNYTVADPFQHAADVQAQLDAHAKRLAAPKQKPKPKRRKATPIVTEHTREQANAIDARQTPVPFQGRQGPVARPSEGHPAVGDLLTLGALSGIESLARNPRQHLFPQGNRDAGGKLLPLKVQPVVQGVVPFGITGRAAAISRATRSTRLLKHEGLTVPIPAAKSGLIGRPIEALSDTLREPISTAGVTKTTAAKTGEELGRTARNIRKIEEAPAIALKRAARHLTNAQQYALRIVAEGKSIPERQQFHLNRMHQADEPANQAYHAIHTHLLSKASPYIAYDAKGEPILAAGAPKKLHESWRLLQQVAKTREAVYKDLAQLSDKAIQGRIQAPGRIIAGAHYLSQEEANAQARELGRSLRRIEERKAKIKRAIDRSAKGTAETVAARGEAHAASRVAEKASAYRARLARELDGLEENRAKLADAKDKLERLATGKDIAHEDIAGFGIRPRGDLEIPRNKALGSVFDESRRLVQRLERQTVAEYALAREEAAAPGIAAAQEEAAQRMERAHEEMVAQIQGGERALHRVSEAERRISAQKAETEASAGSIVGHEDYAGGKIRLPYTRGVPVSLRHQARVIGTYLNRGTSLFGGGGKGTAIGAGPADKALRKQFRAALMNSGFFKANVTNGTADDLITAARLGTAAKVRPELLAAATDLPKSASDIAIKVDPKINSAQELKQLASRIEGIELGDTPKMDLSELEGIDPTLAESYLEANFPRTIEGEPIQSVAERLASGAADIQPIPNIKWIDHHFMENAQLMYVPKARALQRRGLNKIAGGGLGLIDGFNDLQKAIILFLSPAYGPVNLAGNLVMNLMQQGVFLPANLKNAAMLSYEMAPENTAVVDHLMGHGFTVSTLSARTGPGKLITGTLGKAIGAAIDLIPRRAAFLHEARALGYDNSVKLGRLIEKGRAGDSAAHATLDRIARSANDAIVDYDRLSPFEKAWVARIVFFYPWVKGATRYSLRFLVDHPYQATALALAASNANTSANETLGPRPPYAEFAVPISTRSVGLQIPGTNIRAGLDQFVGEHTARDAQGNPIVENVRQLLTPTTPLELGQAGASFIRGDQSGAASQLVQSLTPLPYAALVAAFGYDPFLHRQVPQSLGTFVNQSTQGFPIERSIKNALLSGKDRVERNKKALNPTTRGEDIAKIFGGGLTPVPYNPAVGRSRVAGKSTNYKDKLKALGIAEGPLFKEAINAAVVRKEAQKGNPKTVHGRFYSDLDALVTLGRLSPETRDELKTATEQMSDYELRLALPRIGFGDRTRLFDPQGVLAMIDRAYTRKQQGG